MMRIHGIKLDNVRAIRHLELGDLSDTGVVIIHGDNEAGKSTIMDAIHACLNIPHNSSKQEVRALIPANSDQWPEIWLDLEIGPHRMELYKQFSTSTSSKKCELKFPGSRKATLRNRAADDELAVIISEHLDSDLLNALFVRQGKLDHTLEAAGIASVETALNTAGSQAGDSTVAGGTIEHMHEESTLLSAVNAEFTRYFTEKTARPAKELKAAEEKLAEAEAHYKERKDQVDKLSDHVSEYEELRQREQDAAADIDGAEREVAETAQRKHSAESVQKRYDDAVLAVRQTEKQKNSESGLLDERNALLEDLQRDKAHRDELVEQLREAELREQQENAAIARFQEEKAAAEDHYRKQRELHKAARHAVQNRHNVERINELQELTETVAAIDAEIAAAREKIAALPAYIDHAEWNALRQAHDDVAVEEKLAEAQAARLELQAESPQTITVENGESSRTLVLGTPDDDNQSIALADGMRMRIGDITAVYRSARKETTAVDSALSAVEQAREHYQELLERCGCSDFAQVKEVYMRCSELDEEIAALRHRRDGVVGERDMDSLQQELARLVEACRENVADEQSVADDGGGISQDKSAESTELVDLTELTELPEFTELTREEIAEKVAAADDAEEAARRKVTEIAGALAVYDARPAQREALQLRERYNSAIDNVAATEKKVESRADSATMDKLRENAALANLQWQQAIEARDKALTEVEEVDVDAAVRHWEGAKAHLVHLQKTVENAQHRKLELSSHIEAATGAAERLHKAESELEHRRTEHALVSRRANAAARLRESLLKHRDAARMRYMEPFARQLERFAKVIFDGAVSFELDENLAISQRMIDDTSLSTEQLSGGAQEQLALLVRFAVAALTAREEQGSDSGAPGSSAIPVPVMVDDALGSTDAHRLKLMAALFSEIARQTQVFVLTCMPERYSRIVDAQSFSMRELTAGSSKI